MGSCARIPGSESGRLSTSSRILPRTPKVQGANACSSGLTSIPGSPRHPAGLPTPTCMHAGAGSQQLAHDAGLSSTGGCHQRRHALVRRQVDVGAGLGWEMIMVNGGGSVLCMDLTHRITDAQVAQASGAANTSLGSKNTLRKEFSSFYPPRAACPRHPQCPAQQPCRALQRRPRPAAIQNEETRPRFPDLSYTQAECSAGLHTTAFSCSEQQVTEVDAASLNPLTFGLFWPTC